MFKFSEDEERDFKIIGFIFALTAFFYFMYKEAYGAILIVVLFEGFLHIVVKNKKYNHLGLFAQRYIL